MASEYRAKSPDYFSNDRVAKLRGVQHAIVDYSMTGHEFCRSKGMGIYKVSTTSFSWCAPLEEIQDQLGRDDQEVALLLGKPLAELADEDKKLKQGILTRDFPDLIEYDPENDMIFSKLAYKYSTLLYCKTAKARLEVIHHEYKKICYEVPERWLAEFYSINQKCIEHSIREFSSKDKNYSAVMKTINELEGLQKKYHDAYFESQKPNTAPSNVSSENLKRFLKTFGKC